MHSLQLSIVNRKVCYIFPRETMSRKTSSGREQALERWGEMRNRGYGNRNRCYDELNLNQTQRHGIEDSEYGP